MNWMILYFGLLQVVLPLALIIANTLIPSRSRLGLGLRSATLMGLLVYDAMAGLWLFPPWWTPYFLMVFLIVGAVYCFKHIMTVGRKSLCQAERILAALALIGTGTLLLPAVQGRVTPADAVNLAMPLGTGRYLVVNGGTSEVMNTHLKTLTLDRAHDFRGQSYAIDIIGINQFGLRARGISPPDAKAYLIYGKPVRAPCDGTVAQVIDGVADMPVPQMDRNNMTGNSILLDCGGLIVVLAHLAPDSIAVHQGQSIKANTQVASVGNSGNTSEPHLHIHVQNKLPDTAPISANPVWFTLNGRFLVRNDRFTVRR